MCESKCLILITFLFGVFLREETPNTRLFLRTSKNKLVSILCKLGCTRLRFSWMPYIPLTWIEEVNLVWILLGRTIQVSLVNNQIVPLLVSLGRVSSFDDARTHKGWGWVIFFLTETCLVWHHSPGCISHKFIQNKHLLYGTWSSVLIIVTEFVRSYYCTSVLRHRRDWFILEMAKLGFWPRDPHSSLTTA